MDPEEELKKLNSLIRQYETVFHTTRNDEQRERVSKQLKELRSSRQMILDMNFIDVEALQQSQALDEFKHLRRLLDGEKHRPSAERLERLSAGDAESSPVQTEIFNLALYARFFRSEFLPFLTEKRLKLDYKFSIERSGFYTKFSELGRRIDDFRKENARLSNGTVSKEIEVEVRRRYDKIARQAKTDAAKFFREVLSFCEELVEDVHGDGVKCLNGSEAIVFDDIEGKHLLDGMKVGDALAVLAGLASEVVAYLKVPENDR